DFHGSMEEYEAAKLRLFTELPRQTEKRFWAVLNADDPVGANCDDLLDIPRWRFGIVKSAHDLETTPADYDVRAFAHAVAVDHIEMELTAFGEPNPKLRSRLGGSYNVENLIAAVSALVALGNQLPEACRVAEQARPVPGRFEAVPNDLGIGVLVDYAHTPDALEKLLDAVRPLTKGRVITAFGCGGDRDRTKRPKMAKAASERSDITVVTSDNPRTEDPQSILNEVLTGIVPGRESIDIIDRREAIAHAIKIAQPGDVVVIAGKGHENYQIIGRTKYPMDDRLMAKEALEAR
ncbi:MAG: UDP-N-acetylmuramoyl-L-alanyl-D-glutamate--2,6-diaminopimelate ligase, partial [Chlorobia bacterium]|nr:UDP-N-acetylmuramoyl-L-alanyl-D-glutamate--2,6-diaminopimelate ligase [Fimbriimonadaceae bacterium]